MFEAIADLEASKGAGRGRRVEHEELARACRRSGVALFFWQGRQTTRRSEKSPRRYRRRLAL